MIAEEKLRSCLADAWAVGDATVETHNGGMNSATWFVTARDARWVAKAVVPGSRRSFVGGLTVAGHVEAAGIPAGAPVATRQRDIVADLDGIPLALLPWVGGEELSGSTPNDQRLAAYEALDPSALSWGLLHTDPAPDAFRLDRLTGICGLIDWSVAIRGPLLYDLASAVMYVGGPQHADCLVEAYLTSGTVTRAEVEHGLPAMLRVRWAVQADYFARRLATGDLTGIASNADNEKGLEDARQWLGLLSRPPL